MFKRLLIAASLVAAAFSFQTSAHANDGAVVKFGNGNGAQKGTAFRRKFNKPARRINNQRRAVNRSAHKPVYKAPVHKKVYKAPTRKKFVHHTPVRSHKIRRHHLSNKQLRHRLKSKGLYNIRFVDRHQGVAKVVAHNRRGYIARYRVSTRNGHILSGRVIRNSRRAN
ncbi:MAG: hypothetical protein ABJK39_00140 [Hyphomicrobiales bacterium]